MTSKIIVALDFPTLEQALAFVKPLKPEMCRLKVGKELFAVGGPQFVGQLVDQGFDVFLDLKYHDIPNTVKKACQASAELGVWMLNVHSLGGRSMMEAAKEGVLSASHQPKLIAVTILTSHSEQDLADIGLAGPIQARVEALAGLTQQSGLDGVVCSAMEAPSLRKLMSSPFDLVTPGIRPAGSDLGDQKRVMTPKEAIDAGSTYLVMGRPITQSDDPIDTLNRLNEELKD